MFWTKSTRQTKQEQQEPSLSAAAEKPISLDALKQVLADMSDAEFVELRTEKSKAVTIIFIRTLIDQERINEAVLKPLQRYVHENGGQVASVSPAQHVDTLEQATQHLLQGCVLLHNEALQQWLTIPLASPLSRSIESSETETILFGPKDSFSEQLEQNLTLIRRRLPVPELKAERFTVGSLSQTTVVLMYVEGLTNLEYVSIAREKIQKISFDLFLDSSQVAAFMEEHTYSIFPQFLQTDRPDSCAYALGLGKLLILVNNTPFVLIAPVTFFHLFQSPEDYINRWLVASFLRCLRFLSFFIALSLIPMYVALTTHHYQMLPLQILFVILESRGKLPFTPFWEAAIMLVTVEIVKEASLRMPSKTSQTLGVIGGIVIGQAAVQAGFASKVLIVLMGISTIASFLVPNYLMSKSSLLIQFVFLVLASLLGIPGMILGILLLLAHLNGLTSLKQPYLAPVTPFYGKDWLDLFIRGPLRLMKERPAYLHPLQKWRYGQRRK
ncbi:spore germination protein [Paenibacillus sp. sgz302251]|uniref:spore germination protein n=1 Tax=Paenibacillus sp. sgz302251 TaxID=3414493 RepID=UPI003C79EA57